MEIKRRTILEHFRRQLGQLGYTRTTALTVIVKELVDNSADACEDARILPDICVEIEELKPGTYRVTCTDNGPGLKPEAATLAFGHMLTSARYVNAPTRGCFGLGVKGAILYAYETTAQSAIIETSDGGAQKHILVVTPLEDASKRVQIAAERNPDGWRGTKVCLVVSGFKRGAPIKHFKSEEEEIGQVVGGRELVYYGKDSLGGRGAIERTPYAFCRLFCAVNPHVHLVLKAPDGTFEFKRAINTPVQPPQPIKLHPWGLTVADFLRFREKSPTHTLRRILLRECMRITPRICKQLEEVTGVNLNVPISKLTLEDMEKVVEAFVSRKVKILPPPKDCIPPIGEDILVAGFKNIFKPEFVAYACRPLVILENGHPARVEVVCGTGGECGSDSDIKVDIVRVVNRTPLVLAKSEDITYKLLYPNTPEKMRLYRRYKLDPLHDKITLLVSILGTNIPFTSPAKTSVAEDANLEHEILLGAREVLRNIGKAVTKKRRMEALRKRAEVIKTYLTAGAKLLPELAGKKEPPDLSKVLAKLEGGGDGEA